MPSQEHLVCVCVCMCWFNSACLICLLDFVFVCVCVFVTLCVVIACPYLTSTGSGGQLGYIKPAALSASPARSLSCVFV